MFNNQQHTDEDWQKHAEQHLWDLVEGVEITNEKVDRDGCPVEVRTKMPPNMEAIKFVLKNRSKGKWSDKIEVTSTQINVNLTASYNEVSELLDKQRQQSLPTIPTIPTISTSTQEEQ